MKTRWKILIAVGIFMVLAAASAWLTAHHQPQNAVEDYKKFLRAKGEKLELSEVLPPAVPAESNSLTAMQDAFRMFGSGSTDIPLAMQMVAPGKALTGWKQPDARNTDFTNSWEGFNAGVEADHPAIELLRQVLERPKLDFQLDYKLGAKLPLPHLAGMKRAAQKLEAAVICDLHNRDTGPAVTNILTMLALVERSKSEGLLISHLVRIAMTSIAVTPTWEFLQATNVTEKQLAALQTGWEKMNWVADATNVFAVERAWTINSIQKARATHEGYQEVFGMVGSFITGMGSTSGSGSSFDWVAMTEKPRNTAGEMMWRSSWSYGDELCTLKSGQTILETLRSMQTNHSQFYKADYDAMTTRLSSLGITNSGQAIFRALKIPDMSGLLNGFSQSSAVKKAIKMEAVDRLVVTAVALKRFQLRNRKWPETLDELVPKFTTSVPIDPYDGMPLRYHPSADGAYVLYSVGSDGKDDGGDPTYSTTGGASRHNNWQDDHARDWVWPQPATEAEIKFFYDNPPK